MELPTIDLESTRRRGARAVHYLRRNSGEVIIYVATFAGLLSVLLAADAFDLLYEWSRAHESWQLDEIILAVCALGFVNFAFVLRRWVLEYRDRRKILQLTVDLRRALKAAKGADEAKSAFLANLSHELRTPLNTINGYAELMESGIMGPIDARYVGYAKDIRESGEHLLSIINGILDLTRVASGALDLKREIFSLDQKVHDCFRALAPLADSKEIELVNAVAADFPPLVADPQRIGQVLASLVDNAIKFSPPDSRVIVSAEQRGFEVAVTVRDQGIGMNPEDLSRAVEPFVQLDSDFSRVQEGAGLGLALVKRLVELHSGSLSFDTAPDRGTAVTFTLPQKQALPAAAPLTRAVGA